MSKLLNGDQLDQRARELGVDMSGGNIALRAPDYELQRRVTEAERAVRESRLWILAVISAVASAASAAAALIAVARN